MSLTYVVGARPNFIKLAPLLRAHRERGERPIVIHTGQHYDYELNRIFFEELGLPDPDHHLGVGSGSHAWQTAEMMKRIEDVLLQLDPRVVVVIGDTNSTLAGALAAVKLGIHVAHVEAGVRSWIRFMPEEINRVLVDRISSLLFAPTERAVRNLRREGIEEGVHLTGDVMVDSLRIYLPLAERRSEILQGLGLRPKGYVLMTLHRAENTDDGRRLKAILRAITEYDGSIVFPAHPRTVKAMERFGLVDLVEGSDNVMMIKPVGYFDMLVLEKNASKIVTDSGGVQKEAYILGVPCITLRERTEWLETVEDGMNVLVGADEGRILEALRSFDGSGRTDASKFGDGRASERIVSILGDFEGDTHYLP